MNSAFSFSCTYHDREGTEFDQYRDVVKLRGLFVNLEIENDAGFHDVFKFPWMPDHHSTDMYMSSEIRLQFFGVEVGNSIFTGRPGRNDKSGVVYGDGYGPYGTYTTNDELGYYPDKYRLEYFILR